MASLCLLYDQLNHVLMKITSLSYKVMSRLSNPYFSSSSLIFSCKSCSSVSHCSLFILSTQMSSVIILHFSNSFLKAFLADDRTDLSFETILSSLSSCTFIQQLLWLKGVCLIFLIDLGWKKLARLHCTCTLTIWIVFQAKIKLLSYQCRLYFLLELLNCFIDKLRSSSQFEWTLCFIKFINDFVKVP